MKKSAGSKVFFFSVLVLYVDTMCSSTAEKVHEKVSQELKYPHFSGSIETTKTISLGATLALKRDGRVIHDGMLAALNEINKAGGIHGKIVKLHVLDSENSLSKAVGNIVSLISKTSLFINTSTLGLYNAVIPLLKNKKIMLFGGHESSDSLYKSQYTNFIHICPFINDEIKELVEYASNNLNRRRFAIFYINNSTGIAARDYFKSLVEQKGLQLVAQGWHSPGMLDIASALNDIVSARPDAIVFFAGRHAAYNFIGKVVDRGLFDTTFLGTGYVLPLQSILQENLGVNLIATSYFPNPLNSTLAIVQDFQKSMNDLKKSLRFPALSFAGYLNMRIILAILQRITTPITQESIYNIIRTIQGENIGGIDISFNDSSHQFLSSIFLSRNSNSLWEKVR